MNTRNAGPRSAELSALRRQITELVAQNAVPMVQQAIDAVKEEGQYQAMKYLFEMIGLYPAAAEDETPGQESLARILLDRLGLSGESSIGDGKPADENSQTANPVK